MEARKRRAVGLIAISVVAMVVASVSYVLPGLQLGGKAKPNSITANTAARTPSPAPVYPIAYDFATMSTGWAVVARPIETSVFKTVDGGKHWRLAGRLDEGTYGATIQFVDSTRGFVVTRAPDRLYRTSDGGTHWVRATMPGEGAFRVMFTDPYRGSALVPPPSPTGRQSVFTTEDGGSTWRRLPDVPQGASDPVFRASEAWISASGSPPDGFHVFASYDRGLAWSSVEIPHPAYRQPLPDGPQVFSAEVTLLPGGGVAAHVRVGVACRAKGLCAVNEALFVSFDRGGNWTEVPMPPRGFTYRDIAYQDATHWWALGGDGLVYRSSDSGQTWELISSMAPTKIGEATPALQIFDAQHAWAHVSVSLFTFAGTVQTSAVLVTNDGGHTWTRVLPPAVS
jgi:photosystem II stability/assembly factor-like uncharacterized protein